MVDWILAFVQGVTEFIPVSSSFHLFLVSHFLLFQPQNLDIPLHAATLVTVFLFFRRDILRILKDFFSGRFRESMIFVFATLPVVCAGLCIKTLGWPVSLKIMSINSVIFGILLCFSDLQPQKKQSIGCKESFLIGCGQVLALIPGASRLGCTLTIARFLGISRFVALRFSFLLSIPAVLGALVLSSHKVHFTSSLILIMILTTVIGYASLAIFMRVMTGSPLWPFGLYRIILGLLVFWHL